MRIALAQLNFTIGDFTENVRKMKASIEQAKQQSADLIVFPELAICAYPPRDFLEFEDFISKANQSTLELAASCIGITAIVGAPSVNPKKEGKNLFNTAYVLRDGKIIDAVHKALLPNYDIFDEYRYFEPNRQFHCVEINGTKIALTICEDLWNADDDPMYTHSPMDDLIREQPQLMINIAASPFDYGHAESRKNILLRNVRKYSLPLVYVNHTGAQTEIIFDGGSVAFDSQGNTTYELNYFQEDFQVIDVDPASGNATALTPSNPSQKISLSKTERIYHALVTGIGDYFRKQGFTKAILGLSGGIDSALVTVLATRALGPENVKVLLLPSEFSSAGSVEDSLQLVKNIGVQHEIIPIAPLFKQYLETLKPHFDNLPFNVAEENIQARIRGVLLMAMSNKFGYILLNTSNKSEVAVGYGTLYGDMCGGLSVIGDVYKTEVYDICRFINTEKEIIPEVIINKAPSAELRPNQKDSDSLPDYAVLDAVLYQYIEQRKGPAELIAMGYDEALIRRVMKLVNTNEYKRYQTPPILRVSPKAFGMGRRLPIVGKYLS
ncbi:MAG TPA: NAD+ synthase [Bacteroidia bacterium]|nr:NAD+ synthase [Bacteroidia bacterium]HNP98127.1 NAD+ synthase [Bacteroidia bacterium]